jgi:hypothetical protein
MSKTTSFHERDRDQKYSDEWTRDLVDVIRSTMLAMLQIFLFLQGSHFNRTTISSDFRQRGVVGAGQLTSAPFQLNSRKDSHAVPGDSDRSSQQATQP